MSFILDSLRKAERERQHGAVPDLQAVHAPASAAAARRPRWPWLLGAVLLLTAGLLVWWLHFGRPDTPLPTARTEVAAPATVPAAATAPVRPLGAPPEEKRVSAPAGEGEGKPAAPPPEQRVRRRADLPAAVRQKVPALTMALHYYAEAPTSRLVRINDRNLREGETLADGLVLERITPDGVVLGLRGERFRVLDWVAGDLE